MHAHSSLLTVTARARPPAIHIVKMTTHIVRVAAEVYNLLGLEKPRLARLQLRISGFILDTPYRMLPLLPSYPGLENAHHQTENPEDDCDKNTNQGCHH